MAKKRNSIKQREYEYELLKESRNFGKWESLTHPHLVEKNKKKYNRKIKHNKKENWY